MLCFVLFSNLAIFIKMQPFRKDIILVDNTRDKLRDEIRNLFNTIQGAIRIAEDDEIGQDMKEALVHILSLEKGFLWDDLYASKRIDDFCADERQRRRAVLVSLSCWTRSGYAR